jgi:hypothetical protein
MSSLGTTKEDYSFAWSEFERLCRDQPTLDAGCLYALPLPLIDLIHDLAPGFWTKQQKEFEENLSAISGGIFLAKKQVLRDLFRPFILLNDFAGIKSESPRQLERNRPLGTQKVDTLDASENDLRMAGFLPAEVSALQQAAKDFRGKDEQLRIGFTGWLITNQQFLVELRTLRSQAPESVGKSGRFPILQGGFSTPSYETSGRIFKGIWTPQNEQERIFDKECQNFLQRWCLQSLLNWDIPVPIESSVTTTPDLLTQEANAGIHVFLPWYSLKLKEKKLDKLVRIPIAEQTNTHLQSWVRKGGGEKGAVRYSHLFRLFVYWVCGLERRYGTQIRKWRAKLELAFLNHFGLGKRKKNSVKRMGASCDSVSRLLNKIKKAHLPAN